MTHHRQNVFWIPLLLSVAFFALAPVLATFQIELSRTGKFSVLLFAFMLVLFAGVLAYRQHQSPQSSAQPEGGAGGDADVAGSGSNATGGVGGAATSGKGGKGGSASVKGNNSTAQGGRGGSA